MQFQQLDHVALIVADLAASDRFYGQTLGLPPARRPDFDFPGAWYQIAPGQTLHLIEKRPAAGEDAATRWRGHFAIRVDDIQSAAELLRRAELEFRGPDPRPDGALQIFLRDPDHHLVEFCTAPDEPAGPKLV